jgi:hypothetical protein
MIEDMTTTSWRELVKQMFSQSPQTTKSQPNSNGFTPSSRHTADRKQGGSRPLGATPLAVSDEVHFIASPAGFVFSKVPLPDSA